MIQKEKCMIKQEVLTQIQALDQIQTDSIQRIQAFKVRQDKDSMQMLSINLGVIFQVLIPLNEEWGGLKIFLEIYLEIVQASKLKGKIL
jgi:hypothetical protein